MAPGSVEQLFEERIDRTVAEMIELCILAADPEQRPLVYQQWRGISQILLRAKLILAILEGDEVDQIKRLIVSLDLRGKSGQLKVVSNG